MSEAWRPTAVMPFGRSQPTLPREPAHPGAVRSAFQVRGTLTLACVAPDIHRSRFAARQPGSPPKRCKPRFSASAEGDGRRRSILLHLRSVDLPHMKPCVAVLQRICVPDCCKRAVAAYLSDAARSRSSWRRRSGPSHSRSQSCVSSDTVAPARFGTSKPPRATAEMNRHMACSAAPT